MEQYISQLNRLGLTAGLCLLLMPLPGSTFGADKGKLYPILEEYVRDFNAQFREIPEHRRHRLNEIIRYLEKSRSSGLPGRLLFIDTNQSALSLLVQIWAETAAFYYGLETVEVYSGALQPGAISGETIFSLERAGYIVYRSGVEGTVLYKIKYSYNLEPVMTFAKPIDFRRNPRQDFMGVVLDSNADVNLTRIRGTPHRLTLLYDDPTGYQGSDHEAQAFDEVCRQIALEMFYVFWRLQQRE